MYIEKNIGELDLLFIEILIVLNDLYKKNIIKNVTVYWLGRKWNNVSNVLTLSLITKYDKYSRIIIDLSEDINNNEVDLKILNYEIGKYLPADVKSLDGDVIFYRINNKAYPILLT